MHELSPEEAIRRYRTLLESGFVSDQMALQALRELLVEEQIKMLANAQLADSGSTN